MATKRQCDQCGAVYEAKRSTSQYCSPTCRKNAHRIAAKPEAEKLKAEADRLVELQREHRGYEKVKLPDGTDGLKMGPYEPTAETEARAAEILRLRRRAARLEYPL